MSGLLLGVIVIPVAAALFLGAALLVVGLVGSMVMGLVALWDWVRT